MEPTNLPPPKDFHAIIAWLEAIKDFRSKAPEGVAVLPVADGKYQRFKLEQVDPAAIKEFMGWYKLKESNEWGYRVKFFESESICVLDFEYPFLTPPQVYNHKLHHQDMYRLIWRAQKSPSDESQNQEVSYPL
jgi:hypothetical protein